MQFESEFEWISPSGDGVLTHYMPDHYGPGWELQHAPSVEAAGDIAYQLFQVLKPVAATTQHAAARSAATTPAEQLGDRAAPVVERQLRMAEVRLRDHADFMDRVRAGLAEQHRTPSPQSRDMNPIYTGKDVSYIDTKQAQRAAEIAATDAEKLATFAGPARRAAGTRRPRWTRCGGSWRSARTTTRSPAPRPTRSTSTCSPVGARRTTWPCGAARAASAAIVAPHRHGWRRGRRWSSSTRVAFDRTDLVRAEVETAGGVRVVDDTGAEVPVVVEAPGVVRFVARDVPSMGWRTYRVLEGGTPMAGPTSRPTAGR